MTLLLVSRGMRQNFKEKIVSNFLKRRFPINTEAYLGSSETSKERFFCKDLFFGFLLLPIYAKNSIADVWEGSRYTPGKNYLIKGNKFSDNCGFAHLH